jgi:hypothetical protein
LIGIFGQAVYGCSAIAAAALSLLGTAYLELHTGKELASKAIADTLDTYCSGMTRWIGGKILIQSLGELTLPSTQGDDCCKPTIATIN